MGVFRAEMMARLEVYDHRDIDGSYTLRVVMGAESKTHDGSYSATHPLVNIAEVERVTNMVWRTTTMKAFGGYFTGPECAAEAAGWLCSFSASEIWGSNKQAAKTGNKGKRDAYIRWLKDELAEALNAMNEAEAIQ